MLAFSERKANIIQRSVEVPISSEVAASFLQEHNNNTILLEQAAGEQLTRIKCPFTIRGIKEL